MCVVCTRVWAWEETQVSITQLVTSSILPSLSMPHSLETGSLTEPGVGFLPVYEASKRQSTCLSLWEDRQVCETTPSFTWVLEAETKVLRHSYHMPSPETWFGLVWFCNMVSLCATAWPRTPQHHRPCSAFYLDAFLHSASILLREPWPPPSSRFWPTEKMNHVQLFLTQAVGAKNLEEKKQVVAGGKKCRCGCIQNGWPGKLSAGTFPYFSKWLLQNVILQ